MVTLDHRLHGYRLLTGQGLEIGALHEPAPMPAGASVQYFDTLTEAQAAELFKEIPSERLVRVSFLGNLDNDGLRQFADGVFDFVVINHVLEHLANPVRAIEEVFRICRQGGTVILSIPDKEFTFDRGRELTSWEHLWSDYAQGVRENSDEHYISFMRSAAPHVFDEPPENLPLHIAYCRSRREHAHVWNSESFERFVGRCLRELGIPATLVYRSVGRENQIEFFSVWTKA